MYVKDGPIGGAATEQPLISVVMTTYNGARYLAEQIESILGQTYRNFELLVADDRSTDATLELLQNFAARDARVRYYVNDTNLGINRNLSTALGQVRGELIAIADQDDIWETGKLWTLYDHIGGNSAVYSDSLLIDDYGQPLGVTLQERLGVGRFAVGNASLVLLRKNCVSGHALLFRKKLLPLLLPFESNLMFDQQIGVAAVLNDGLSYVDEVLVKHRIHQQNQTNGSLRSKSVHEGTKAERYRKRRASFVQMLGFFLTHIERNPEHYRNLKHTSQLREKVSELIARMQRFDRNWFDLRLFLLLLSLRKDLFYSGEPNTFKRCLTYAKGARYYQ